MAVEIDGLEELLEKFERMGRNFAEEIEPALKEASEVVAADARAACPVSADEYYNSRSGKKNPPGYLRNSIGVKLQKSKNKYKIAYSVQPLKKDAYYGVFVEYNVHSNKNNGPFMRPAADKNRERVKNILAQRIRRIIESG